jgi:hypothetical protein
MMNIPKTINSWDKRRIAEHYIDDLRWNLTPLKKGSKIPLFSGDKRYGIDRKELLTHLSNGANFALFPAGEHVVLDLDSKHDDGKSTAKFLSQSGPKVQTLPRERTAGGVHLHFRIKDLEDVIRKPPNAGKLINKKVASKVVGELFFGGKQSVMVSPSVHELGTVYHWEVTGEIPEWTWQKFQSVFGQFLPDKKDYTDEAIRGRQWKGDLKTLDIVALAKEVEWYHDQDTIKPEIHSVICPWCSEHTDGKLTASVFTGNGNSWPGFNCFHAHCAGHGIVDFLECAEAVHPGIVDKHCSAQWRFEGDGSRDKRGRVQIILPSEGSQENDDFVHEVGEALKDKEFWFKHGPDVVRVAQEEKIRNTPDGEVEACERLHLRQVTATVAHSTLGTHVATGRIKMVETPGKSKEPVFLNDSISPTVAKMLLGAPGLLDSLPRIDRLLDIPIPIPIGEKKWILQRRGYNPKLHILVDQDIKLRRCR